MFDMRPVLNILGVLLCMMALFMLAPLLLELSERNGNWTVFAGSAGCLFFIGGLMFLVTRTDTRKLSIKQAFILTNIVWIVLAAAGAIPLRFSHLDLSFTDAFFEAMSGITTTGSTTMQGLDHLPRGVLLWRSILQWVGGVGIVVMVVAILPILQVGGMQIFRMEFTDRVDKVLPRITEIILWLFAIYIGLTVLCAFFYWQFGMSEFDAINHALTTLSTGGYSTHDASFGYFKSPALRIICIIFMILSALPFILYLKFLQGDVKALFKDSQVRAFFAIVFLCVATLSTLLIYGQGWSWGHAILESAFSTASVISTTGYATSAYDTWGPAVWPIIFGITLLGGCAGSTAGGAKVYRLQIFYLYSKVQLQRLLQPHGVFVPYYGGHRIDDALAGSVTSFFFLYFSTLGITTCILGFYGVDFVSALTGAATAIANVGPGLGHLIGPAGNFVNLPSEGKWALSFAMLIGRLEVFAVLVMFLPSFWRR